MPDETGSPLAVALRLLRADAPVQIIGAPENWPRWSVLLPHVLAATRYSGPAGEQPGPDVMDDVSWLLDRAGGYLQVQARFTDARAARERALAITEAVHGPDHPTAGTRLSNLAAILQDLGLPAEARPVQERALAIDEAVYGPDHATVAICLSNLAAILKDLGLPAEARPLQERALAITEAVYGPDHPTVATCLNNLAQILQALGLPAEGPAAARTRPGHRPGKATTQGKNWSVRYGCEQK
jgi:tetratricopeptide (TPR) repeat protein